MSGIRRFGFCEPSCCIVFIIVRVPHLASQDVFLRSLIVNASNNNYCFCTAARFETLAGLIQTANCRSAIAFLSSWH